MNSRIRTLERVGALRRIPTDVCRTRAVAHVAGKRSSDATPSPSRSPSARRLAPIAKEISQ